MDLYTCNDCGLMFEVLTYAIGAEPLGINYCPSCGSEFLTVEICDE